MLKTIWMSDPHYVDEGHVLGHDPHIRTQAAIDYVMTHHSDAQHCIISGDMVNDPTPENYTAIASYFKKLPMPVFPMVGNHDDRALLRASFALPDTCMDDFIQYKIPTKAGVVICLDTLDPGVSSGAFCAERMAWLEGALKAVADTRVYLFMHHPPLSLGLPLQDAEKMVDGDAFLDLVSGYSCVKHMFIGHVHRAVSGTVRGIPYATMRSLLFQAPAIQADWTDEIFMPAKAAPHLGVLEMDGADVRLQYAQFCAFETGFAPE